MNGLHQLLEHGLVLKELELKYSYNHDVTEWHNFIAGSLADTVGNIPLECLNVLLELFKQLGSLLFLHDAHQVEDEVVSVLTSDVVLKIRRKEVKVKQWLIVELKENLQRVKLALHVYLFLIVSGCCLHAEHIFFALCVFIDPTAADFQLFISRLILCLFYIVVQFINVVHHGCIFSQIYDEHVDNLDDVRLLGLDDFQVLGNKRHPGLKNLQLLEEFTPSLFQLEDLPSFLHIVVQ